MSEVLGFFGWVISKLWKYRLISGPFVAMLLAAGFVAAVTRSRAAAAGAGIVMALITFFALLIMTPI